MCNNVVALGNSTADGRVIFGKNSDRAPNEAHILEFIPAREHPPDSVVCCTYVEVPQVEHANAVLLARPCWMWGAEMGTNEHGLTIGNTAVYTRVPYDTGPGLLGMDFLRLALERASTAWNAVEVITGLLETFGQAGNCGFRKSFYYHNSFLMADHESAWILETAGRHWVAEQVKDVRATSNTLTITSEGDIHSSGLVDYATKKGWHKPGRPFNFKTAYGGKGLYPSYLWTLFGRGDRRQNRLTGLLESQKGKITVDGMMAMLRDHGAKAGADYSPSKGYFGNTVCMHAGCGPIRTDQTTGSMVSELRSDNPIHWFTGTSAPCTSVFKPVWLDTGVPDTGVPPTGQYCKNSLWWNHEHLHREVLKDYPRRMGALQSERDELEREFVAAAEQLGSATVEERRGFSEECFRQAAGQTELWTGRVAEQPIENANPFLYRKSWEQIDREAFFYGRDAGGTTTVP